MGAAAAGFTDSSVVVAGGASGVATAVPMAIEKTATASTPLSSDLATLPCLASGGVFSGDCAGPNSLLRDSAPSGSSSTAFSNVAFSVVEAGMFPAVDVA